MTEKETKASASKAGWLAGVTTAIAAKLALMDNYPGRPTADVFLTGLLLAVCVGVSVGYGWARVRKELEQRRRGAAEAASVAERQAKALEALARQGNEL
jgi:hypothetical protein